MITGFNTDVKHAGRVFHVQTEDKGKDNPKIETLIYVGGQILDSVRFDYKEKISDGFDEALVTSLMEEQHRRIVRDIKTGKYDTGDESLNELLSRKTLDEIVLACLSDASNKEEMILLLDNEGQDFSAGAKVHLRLSALTKEDRNAIGRVRVTIKILSVQHEPASIYEGYTDGSGVLETAFSLPDLSEGTFTLLIQGEHADYESADIKYLIRNS